MVRLAHHEWFDRFTTNGLKGTPRNGEQACHEWFDRLTTSGIKAFLEQIYLCCSALNRSLFLCGWWGKFTIKTGITVV